MSSLEARWAWFPNLCIQLLIALCFDRKSDFFFSFPSFVISLEVALGTFSITVVINPESEGAGNYSQGKHNIDKRGGWTFRGGCRKALRQRSTLK